MGIIAWIILGLIAGAIAKKVMPGDGPGGFIVTILLGIAGALLGGFLGSALFGVDAVDGFFEISTWVAAIIGAVILLFLYQLLTGRRSRV